MSKRKQPTLTNKLAAALLALGDIPHDDAKQMTDLQVISLYQFDHYPVPYIHEGPTVGWNLVPRLIKGHRVKTAKIDRPMIAKTRRVEQDWKLFTARMAAKAAGGEAPKERPRRKIPSRPFPKRPKGRDT